MASNSVTKMQKAAIKSAVLKLDQAWSENDYYTVQQVYKSLYGRYKQASMTKELREMLVSGAVRLLDCGEIASAGELGSLLIENYQESKETPSKSTIDPILQIFSHYKVEENHPSKTSFIRQACAWSQNKANGNQGSSELHTAFANHFFKRKDYLSAQKHFLRSDDMLGYALMLVEWCEDGYPGEEDLFFTRAILMLLALGNLKMANILFKEYSDLLNQAQKSVPLYNFCRFLLLTLERDALPLYDQLRKKYEPSLARDPTFAQYLDQIASVFFGVKKSSGGGLNGLMGSLFKSFMSNE